MSDIFAECRDRVSAEDAARLYGVGIVERGGQAWCKCPFSDHTNDNTPSLRFYGDSGTFYCFGCHRGGGSINFVMSLYGLDALDAVKKLNQDFSLALPLGKRLSESEIRQTEQERRRKQAEEEEARAAFDAFQDWCFGIQHDLITAADRGRVALRRIKKPEDFATLTPGETAAIKYAPWAAETWTELECGISSQMAVFSDRKGVEALCRSMLT